MAGADRASSESGWAWMREAEGGGGEGRRRCAGHGFGVGTDGDEMILRAKVGGQGAAERFVMAGGPGAEFLHAADKVEARGVGRSRGGGEGGEGVEHRGRIGVVAVEVDGPADSRVGGNGQLLPLAAQGNGLPAGEPGTDIRRRDAEVERGADGEGGVLRHAVGDAREFVDAGVDADGGGGRGMEGGVRERSGRDARAAQGEAAGAERVEKDGFFAGDGLEVAEGFEVRGSDERDDGDVGLDHRGERGHLAGSADAGFDHGKAVARGIEPRERERHAQVIVEVAFGGKDVARIGGKEEGQQVFGGRLAGAAGDADHGTAESAAVFARDRLEGGERVGDDELGEPGEGGIAGGRRHESGGRAGSAGGGEVIVAIALRGAQGDEDLAGAERARVGAETGQKDAIRRKKGPAGGGPGGELRGGEHGRQVRTGRRTVRRFQVWAKRLIAMSSRTTWRSSKGVTVSANS